MSMEDVSRVVMEVDSESHGHSQRQGHQSLLVLSVQSGAHGDPQVRNGRHLEDNEQVWELAVLKTHLPRRRCLSLAGPHLRKD